MSITKFHTPLTKIALALFTAASSLVLSSCQDEDYGFTTDEVRASVYKRNFEGTYGEIDPNQTWDFSSYNLRKLGLAGGPSAETRGGVLTRAEIPDLVTKYNSGWYTVSSKTTDWLNANLKEKKNNTKYVSSFDWEKSPGATADPLYIIPIYQGQTGMIWDLELVDLEKNTATIIWRKSENIRYTQDFSNWEEFFYESYNDDEAPYKNDRLGSVLFKKPLDKVPADYTSSSDIIAAFNVSKNFDVVGSFYIQLGSHRIEVSQSNFSEFFSQASTDGVIADGKFKFTSNRNTELGVNNSGNRYLTSGAPNKVYLNKLLGKKITIDDVEYTISVADLKTLEFVIDADSSPKEGNFNDLAFNTWNGDRIQVFVKYYTPDADKSIIQLQGNTGTQYTVHHTINKYNVQTRPIKIDINQLPGKSFAFNLKTTYRGDGDKDLSEIGDDHRSDLGFMSQIKHFGETGEAINAEALKTALSSDFSIDLGDTFEYMVIGCEDAGANGKSSDNDYNDLVLLLVGKTLPTQTIRKRYMIEDLGSTLDFDFNDIVVDVTEKVANVSGKGKTYTQTAKIRHLRGTIPFRVTIGTKAFGNGGIMRGHNVGGKAYDPSDSNYSTNYSWEYTQSEVDDTKLSTLRHDYWNPDANNIKVEVWPNYNSENETLSDVYWNGADAGLEDNSNAAGNNVQRTQIVEFPKVGKVPYIIATDQTVGWMDENISIPESWIATHPSGWNNGFDQAPDNNSGNLGGSGASNDGRGNKLMNPTTLTPGAIALKNNLSVNNSITLSPSELSTIYRGEDIVVHVDGEQLYDKSRLVFKTGDGEPISGIGVNGKIVANGDYKITLTNDMLSKGLTIDCENVTLTSITAGGSTVNNGYDVAASANKIADGKVIHSYSDGLTLNNNDLQNLYAGDKIVVHVSNLREDSKLSFKKNTNNWPGFDYDSGLLINESEITNGTGATTNNNASVTGDIVLLLNKDNLADIQNGNGLVINGQHVTITSVTVDKAGNSSTITNNNKVTGGFAIDGITTTAFNGWGQNITISKDKFSKLSAGDKVVVHVDNLRGNGSGTSAIGLHLGDWTKAISDVNYSDQTNGNFYNVKGDVELNVTATNLDEIISKGIIIQGMYVTVTGVSIVPASTYALKVNVMPNSAGTVTIDGKSITGNYDGQGYGTTTLVASEPASGYEFLAWAGKGNPSTNRTFTVTDASTLYAYYGNVIFSGQEIEAGDYNSYPLFRVSVGDENQKSRYQKLVDVLSPNNSQLMIYFTDSNASGHINLKTEGNEDGGWGWTNLPSIKALVDAASSDEAKAKAEEIELKNGVARYKLSADDVTRIKDEKSLGLTILSSDGSLKISKIIVTSTWY